MPFARLPPLLVKKCVDQLKQRRGPLPPTRRNRPISVSELRPPELRFG
jgi:hypothetical protein